MNKENSDEASEQDALYFIPQDELSKKVHTYPVGMRKTDVPLRTSNDFSTGKTELIIGCILFPITIACYSLMLTLDEVTLIGRVIGAVFPLFAFIILLNGIYRTLANSKLAIPKVQLDTQSTYLGEMVAGHFSQTIKKEAAVQEVVIKLICRHKKILNTRKTTETIDRDKTSTREKDIFVTQQTMTNADLQIDNNTIQCDFQLHVPRDAKPSGWWCDQKKPGWLEDPNSSKNHQFFWIIETKTVVDSWPDYTASFKLKVKEPKESIKF